MRKNAYGGKDLFNDIEKYLKSDLTKEQCDELADYLDDELRRSYDDGYAEGEGWGECDCDVVGEFYRGRDEGYEKGFDDGKQTADLMEAIDAIIAGDYEHACVIVNRVLPMKAITPKVFLKNE